MSKEKVVSRTLISAYKYEVMKREGNGLQFVQVIHSAEPIRSTKKQQDLLESEKLDKNFVLVPAGTIEQKYEMTENDFIKYATLVADKVAVTDENDKNKEEKKDGAK
jgi:hypothetical protein